VATIVKKTMKDGSTRWQAFIRRGGIAKKRTCRTRAAAERWATTTEAAIFDGKELPSVDAERRTVAQAIDAYLGAGVLGGLWTEGLRRAQLEWWRGRRGSERLRELSRARIRLELAALEAGETPTGRSAAPATRRRYLAALRAFLSWCIDSELVDRNAAAGAARKGRDVEPTGRVRYLTDTERQALLEACDSNRDPRLAPLVRLALLTGMRQGELLGLRWRDLDLDRQLASLSRAKAGARPVALSGPAVAILRDLHGKRVVGWPAVFAAPPYGRAYFPRTAFERATEAAELRDFRFHDLRHTFASALLSAGATLPELAAALGHKTLAMVARYAHLERPHAATLAERVAERLSGG
jgi:integrase